MSQLSCNMDKKRPTQEEVELAISKFLAQQFSTPPSFSLCEDGETSWAFWILEDDPTSYINHDLKIEWCGSNWDESQEQE